MILVRDIFQLKFGKTREAINLFRESPKSMQNFGAAPPRLLTDLTGQYYTMVLEITFESLADYEKSFKNETSSSDWQSWYQRFIPLVDSGKREIFTVVQ